MEKIMKKSIIARIVVAVVILVLAGSFTLFASEGTVEGHTDTVAEAGSSMDFMKYIAAGVAIGAACISSGIAIGKIGSAAMGAVAERPEAGGTAIILAALAEGVCLWGFLIAFFILNA
jgi:V/A-type H+-transporting ATPase subunit K